MTIDLNTLLQFQSYSLPRREKHAIYTSLLTELTQLHRTRCPAYGRLLQALGCPEHM